VRFLFGSITYGTMHGTELRILMRDALSQLDVSFGRLDSGRVISGKKRPSYKDVIDREDPLRLTQRVLVYPMMDYLGYTRLFSGDVFEGRIPGLSIATVSMNSDLSSASSRMILSMNADDAPKGIATDGFRWIMAVRSGSVNRICAMSDLRPYYVETLDRDRFREAEYEDDGDLIRFVQTFTNRG